MWECLSLTSKFDLFTIGYNNKEMTAWFTSWALPLVIPISLTVIDTVFPVWRSSAPIYKIQRQIRKIEWSAISYTAMSVISWYILEYDNYVFSRLWALPLVPMWIYTFLCFTDNHSVSAQYIYDNSDRVLEEEIVREISNSKIQLTIMILCQSISSLILYQN